VRRLLLLAGIAGAVQFAAEVWLPSYAALTVMVVLGVLTPVAFAGHRWWRRRRARRILLGAALPIAGTALMGAQMMAVAAVAHFVGVSAAGLATLWPVALFASVGGQVVRARKADIRVDLASSESVSNGT
jgi:uncharacterized membrane protein